MDKQISRRYFNEQATQWDKTARNNDPLKLRAMMERLKIHEGGCVLDVGTGTGVFLPYIKEKMNHSGSIISMDFAFNMLSIAKGKNNGTSIQFVCSEIETLRFCCEPFDAVICYSTFPHFHDKPRAIKNMHTILKPGGVCYICHTASRETINAIHLHIADFKDHLLPEKQEMIALFQQSGFAQVEVIEVADFYLVSAKK